MKHFDLSYNTTGIPASITFDNVSMNTTHTQSKPPSDTNWMVVAIIFMVTTSVSIVILVVFYVYHRRKIVAMRNENEAKTLTSKVNNLQVDRRSEKVSSVRYVADPTRCKEDERQYDLISEDEPNLHETTGQMVLTNAPCESTANKKKIMKKNGMPPRPRKKVKTVLRKSVKNDQGVAIHTDVAFEKNKQEEVTEKETSDHYVGSKEKTSEEADCFVNERFSSDKKITGIDSPVEEDTNNIQKDCLGKQSPTYNVSQTEPSPETRLKHSDDSDVKASTSADDRKVKDSASIGNGRIKEDVDSDPTSNRNSGESGSSCDSHSTEISIYENRESFFATTAQYINAHIVNIYNPKNVHFGTKKTVSVHHTNQNG